MAYVIWKLKLWPLINRAS